jgi:hypothetical protein
MSLPGILASLFNPEHIIKGIGRGISTFAQGLSEGKSFGESLGKGVATFASNAVGDGDNIKENVTAQTSVMKDTNSRNVTNLAQPIYTTNPRNITSTSNLYLERDRVPVDGGLMTKNGPRTGTEEIGSKYQKPSVAPYENPGLPRNKTPSITPHQNTSYYQTQNPTQNPYQQRYPSKQQQPYYSPHEEGYSYPNKPKSKTKAKGKGKKKIYI